MKKFASVVLSLLASLLAAGQQFDYNVGFDYLFNNYEYGISRYFVGADSFYPYQHSHTVHGARLTPEAGLLLPQNQSVYHRLRVGIDVFKQMGEQVDNLGLFREIILYYNVEAKFSNNGVLEAFAGCFPRRNSSGTGYYGPVFDSEYAYLDPNLEGFMVKYTRGNRIRAELIFDWQGMIGDIVESPWRRERFQVLSDGRWRFAGDFSLGWTASIYHYSKSPNTDNVVDYNVLNPRLEWAPFTWMDDFRLELGGIFTQQCDRVRSTESVFPMGLWSLQTVSKWHVSLTNRFYFGDDLMPFFDRSYAGMSYGRDIYRTDPGFKTLQSKPSWADWLTVAWQPRIANWLSLDVAITLHAGQPIENLGVGWFRGSNQRIGLRVDLDAIRPHPKAPKPSRTAKKQGITL